MLSTFFFYSVPLISIILLFGFAIIGKTNSIPSMMIPNPAPPIITRKQVKQLLNPKGCPVASSHVGGNGSHFLKILSKAPVSLNLSMWKLNNDR